MTKKHKSIIKRITHIALAAALCLSAALPALAAGEPIKGNETKPAETAITKVLKMGESVTTPSVTFSFEIEPVSVDGETSGDDFNKIPPINKVEIPFNAQKTGSVVNGVKIVREESKSIFANITWPHAGVYVFNVKEITEVTPKLGDHEKIIYSEAKYKLTVYVANGNNGLYVASIGAEIVVTDGEPGTQAGDKVDGRPGGDPNITGDYSKMTFTNTYMKNAGTGDPMDYVLAVSKKVTTEAGSEYDFANREMYFEFLLTVTKSPMNTNAAQKYRAYVLDAGNKVVTSKDNYKGTILKDNTYGDYFEFTTGVSQTVYLKHGEWISFTDLEIGAKYEVKESAKKDFTPSCEHTINGVKTTLTGIQNTNFSIEPTLITEKEDRADFINIYKSITPTGIGVDNLPYVVMIGVAFAALASFIVLKSRRRISKYNA